MLKVHRTDVGNRIRVDHKTTQGHVRIPARFSRTGVQSYTQADGTVRREYRPPEEVFSPASIHSFDTATVVEGHPAMVDPSNWRDHGVGDIRNTKRDGIYSAGDIIVRDQKTIDKINADELCEISCGYDCQLEMTPGTSPEGEKYDAIQRGIVINHIGLGPRGWGRAGSEVRLRLDGGEVAYLEVEDSNTRPSSMTPEEIAALKKESSDAKARADAAEAKLAAATTKPPTTDGSVDRIVAQRDDALEKVAELKKLTSAAHLDGLINARVAVIDGARLLHGKTNIPTTGSIRDIQVAAIQARDANFKADGRSDDYVASRFDTKVEDAMKSAESNGALNFATTPRSDAATQDGGNELAAAMRHYDAALEFGEFYARANPWQVGDRAAREAALAAMKAS